MKRDFAFISPICHKQRSMLHIRIIPSIYGNGKQMKECDNTTLLLRSGLLKNKNLPFDPL